MNPWPWRRLRDFPVREKLARFAKKSGIVLTILGVLLSPLGFIAHAAAYWRWRVMNDNWYSRPGLLALTGFIGTLTIQITAADGVVGFYRWVLTSFGTPSEIPAAIVAWVLIGAFPSMLVTSVQSAGFTLVYEFDQKVWTRPMRPNLFKRFRAHRHTQTLKSGAEPVKGHIVFGLHVDDTLPWGNGRHGAYVTKAAEKIGHGFILGQAGSGKTAEALNLADQFIHAGMSLVFPDFKGDNLTRRSLKASCETAGVPFYSFSFTPMGDEPNVHYDPLNWEGSSNDKAALIMKALPFPAEDSAAAYYRTKAEAYLPLQFDVLNRVGLAKGEGTFDFLLSTVEPLRLIERLEPLRGGDAAAKEEFSRWHAMISSHSAKDLEGLRGNLGKVVNAGGKYLRPATEDGAVTLDLRKVVDEGAVVYFDLPQTLDSVSSITMGTLLMQDVKAMIGQRSKNSGHDWRDVILMSDEASALGLRADVMDDISKQGRSAKIWNWVVTQSIITWPETTMREVLNNATVRIVFVMQEGESQKLLTEGMPESYYIDVRKGIDLGDANMMETSHRAGRAGTEQALTEKQLTPSDIGKIPNWKAWIWFSGTNEGVKLVHGFARKRWLPVKDEAPSEVVVISPVLRQRVSDIISDKGRTSNAISTVPGNTEAVAAAADETWTLERLPAPDPSYLAATPPESSATVPGRRPMVADIDDEDDFEDPGDGPAGSEPLHVTLARMNRKTPAATGAGPSGSTLVEESRPVAAVPSPATTTAPSTEHLPAPAVEAPPAAAATVPAPWVKVNPLMVQANPLLAKPVPAPAPEPEVASAPAPAPEPDIESEESAVAEPAREVDPGTPEPMSAPAPAAASAPPGTGAFVNRNPFA
jgi:hypothetical protein